MVPEEALKQYLYVSRYEIALEEHTRSHQSLLLAEDARLQNQSLI